MKKAKKIFRIIRRVKRKTNENYITILNRLIVLKKNKIPLKYILKKQYYNTSIKNYKKFGEQINAKKIAIKKTIKYDKCSKKDTLEKVEFANEIGIKYYTYLKNKCWEFNKAELKEYKECIKKQKEKAEFDANYYAHIAEERINITFDEAIKRLKLIRKKGYYNIHFITSLFYLLTEEEIDALKPYQSIAIKPDKKIESHRNEYKNNIMKEMNWKEGTYRLEYLKSLINCGCSKEEFYLYKLYKLSPKKQLEYLTNYYFFKMEMRYSDFLYNYQYFHDKSLFNTKFKKYVKRVWFTNENISFDKFCEKTKNLDIIIYKPIDQLQGKGFRKFNISTSSKLKKAYKYIKKAPLGVVEEFIKQHKETAKFAPNSVNSLRIATMYKNGKVDILGAVFRTGLNKNFDNWSAGGIICGVDTKTGIVNTDGATKQGKIFKEHPISKIKYRGFQIPNWNKIVKTLNDCSKVIDDMPYIGWDITITEKGNIEIIEGNHNHDIRMFQSIYAISENKGIEKCIDKYMWFDKKWGK